MRGSNDKRTARKRRASRFLRENGLLIAALICLTILGGTFALVLGTKDRTPQAPAERSYDEDISQALDRARTAKPTTVPDSARATKNPANTDIPGGTPKPTLMPELTPAPSSTPQPKPRDPWTSPVDGRLIRVYAMDCLIWSKTLGQWMTHPGVDIAAPKGSEVRSIEAGVVEKVYDDDMLGTTVVILHDGGMRTVYSGLKKETAVKEGDRVEIRQLIGYVGDTAISECAEESHLHFELMLNDQQVDPVNYVIIKNGEAEQ
ncbi:MAG: M23 family metallopeptidase [Clostridiales bacterium]|nr:M23 family metallopeptidase [Clostridiales bacterium]